jgi:hypothetical protein
MSEAPIFMGDCGSNTPAASHTQQARTRYVEVAIVTPDGTLAFDEKAAPRSATA